MIDDVCYCIMLRKAARRVSACYDEALAPLGINVSQYSLLRNIRAGEPLSLTDLAERVELDRSTVGRNTKVLQRMGLVEHGQGTDQREVELMLSSAARELLEQAAPLWDQVQTHIRNSVGEEGSDALALLLKSL